MKAEFEEMTGGKIGARMMNPGQVAFVANWKRFVVLHFAMPTAVLQRYVPYRLLEWQGIAWVSLVAFDMEALTLRVGAARFNARVPVPFGNHPFLNVRTYVQHEGEEGIYFLAEYINNALDAFIGPVSYGLPYKLAEMDYTTIGRLDFFRGNLLRDGAALKIEANLYGRRPPIDLRMGSLEHFLFERYNAFTVRGTNRYRFRVCHEPWQLAEVSAYLGDDTLLENEFEWWGETRYTTAHYAKGFEGVRMGLPEKV